MPIIRSISGLRATIPDSLSEQLIADYCNAFSELIPIGQIIIGRDGRPSGTWIESVATKSFVDHGHDVLLAGVVPTPTVQLLTETTNAVAGLVITASHNPSEWNGLKFIDENGVFLDQSKNINLWEKIDSGCSYISTSPGQISELRNSYDTHIRSILNLPMLIKYIDSIKSMNLKIVVDAVNSSGSVIVPKMLDALGIETINLFCDGTGKFPHTPEPLPQNLNQLADAVKKHNADIGIAVDPDADRLVLIDNDGKPIGEELTISLAIDAVLSNKELFTSFDNNVVVNLSTTRLTNDIAEVHGYKLLRSPVGEINVVNKMKQFRSPIGGEGSGGVILPDCHYGRDSLVGIALILSLLAQRNKSLSDQILSYPKYYIEKYKMNYTGNIDEVTKLIQIEYSKNNINIEDGIRVDFEKSWVQLRQSNTEPIVRIIAEAMTQEESLNLIENFKKYLA